MALLQAGGAAQLGQAVFPARLQLLRSELKVDGKLVRLSVGLDVTAEVKTGRGRMIRYLIGPIQQQLSESFGER